MLQKPTKKEVIKMQDDKKYIDNRNNVESYLDENFTNFFNLNNIKFNEYNDKLIKEVEVNEYGTENCTVITKMFITGAPMHYGYQMMYFNDIETYCLNYKIVGVSLVENLEFDTTLSAIEHFIKSVKEVQEQIKEEGND